MANFDFHWKFKDFEIRTTHTYGDDEIPYLELIKWDEHGGKRYCFTLAYWFRDKDGDYELRFVCERPLEYIADVDIGVIWKQMYLAQQMFEDAERKSEECES